ncbi:MULTISPECIES: DUF4917 family protein [unclassified Aureimonas]|uniref:DUF4917 family protein n=1 Tax=unclassified Aureimonas TaxID=2615206 RepID=UPI0009ECA2AE|nr:MULTISPECIES: DUF4917 family protein [unclassified Aureimonas]
MVDVISFAEAIADSRQFSKRHLLIGNGFSIACCPDIFHYGSLFKAADFSDNPELVKVFEVLGTQDFEIAIKNLEAGARLSSIYTPGHLDAAEKMQADANALKEILLTAIARNHPDVPADIPDEKFWSCRRFLNLFLGANNDGQVYTLNYDLLLYWTLMHGDNPFGEAINLATNDGFGNDEDDPLADYVVWQGEVAAHSAKVHFLHGALHLFDAGMELQKFTWVRTNNRLIDQAREAINANKYPLFVTEGSSSQKKEKIRHNAYLYQGFKQLTANAQTIRHCFFILGHSLAENDDHILKRFGAGKFAKMYVSLFGDPNAEWNKQIINKANSLAAKRSHRFPLEVAFYDASTANPWEYA